MKKIILFGTILFTLGGHGVSRVGGGKIQSVDSEFEAELPPSYAQIIQSDAKRIIAKGPSMFAGSRGLIDLNLYISEFSEFFSELKDLGPQEFKDAMGINGWSEFGTFDACIVGLKQTNADLASYLFTWGAGKGFVINTPNVQPSDSTVHFILKSLRLMPGACSWK